MAAPLHNSLPAPQNQLHIGTIGALYLAFGAIVLSGAIFPFLKGDEAFAFLRPNLLYQASVSLIALIGTILLLPAWRDILARFAAAPLLLALILWMLFSQVWTYAPQARLSVLVALLTSTIYGTYLALALPRRDVLRVLALTALVIMAASLVYTYLLQDEIFAFPGLQRMAGLYSNKNILVRAATFSGAVAVFLLVWSGDAGDRRDTLLHKLAWLVLLVMAAWMIAQYYTFTAKIAVAGAIAAVALAWAGSINRRLFYILCGVALLVMAGFVFYIDEILAFARESSGLKNRLFHWGLMIKQDLVSPWTGAGLGGFWDRDTGPWKVLALLTPLRHGHNGFIDSWLDMGFVGLLLVIANLFKLVVGSLRKPFSQWQPPAFFAASIFVIFIIYNLAESSILPTNSANTFLWAVFVAMILSAVIQKKNQPFIQE